MNESMLYLHMQTFRCASLALYKYLEKDQTNGYKRLAAKEQSSKKKWREREQQEHKDR